MRPRSWPAVGPRIAPQVSRGALVNGRKWGQAPPPLLPRKWALAVRADGPK